MKCNKIKFNHLIKLSEQEFLFSSAFTFTFKLWKYKSLSLSILVSRLQEKIIVCFAYIYTSFTFLWLKQNMDPLLFLIKKHNYNKIVRYNDKLSYIMFINKNE